MTVLTACMKLITLANILLAVVTRWFGVAGHGRLIEPPSRASMWRYGYDSPPDYHDNQLWCGGFTVQWQQNGGQCGVCGDVWNSTEPRDHELGGRYTTGTIVRRYKKSGTVNVIVELTASHGGYFEFRLCSLDGQPEGREASWDCLNRHQLDVQGNAGKRYKVNDSRPMKHQMTVELPTGMECSHCVFQWKYNTGNSWGKDANGKSCLGCGPQEQFFGCADVAIGNKQERPRSKKSKSTTAASRESFTSAAAGLKMTTNFELIKTTTPRPKTEADLLKTANDFTATVKLTSAAVPLQDLHDQHKRLSIQTTTVPYQLSLMMSTASFRSAASAVTPALIETTYASDNSRELISSPQTTAARDDDDDDEDDDVVEHRHETMFAGQQFTMVVYSRDSQQHATEAARNISRADLVELDPTGSLYVVPAWYVIVDQVTKQVNVIEPKLLAEITARLSPNGSR